LDLLNIPACAVNEDGAILVWNKTLQEWTGYSLHDVQKSTTAALCLSSFHHDVNQCLKGLVSESMSQTTLKCRNGTRFPVSIRTTACGSDAVCFFEEVKAKSSMTPKQQEQTSTTTAITDVPREDSSSAFRHRVELRVDSSTMPVFVVDSEGTLLSWNQPMTELVGRHTMDELLRHPDVQTMIASSLAGEELTQIITIRMPQSEHLPQTSPYKTLQFTTMAQRNQRDINIAVALLVQDMTHYCQLQEQVAETQTSHTVLQNANLIVIGINKQGIIDYWNPKAEKISGNAKAKGMQFSDFIAPPLRDYANKLFHNAFQGTPTENFELEFKSFNNETLYLLCSISSRYQNGTITGALLFCHNVTEAAQHDRAVAEMANELRQLLDTANAPILGIDTAGQVNEWNDKMVEIVGYTADEAFGRPFLTFLHPDHRHSVNHILEAALKGRGTTNFELEIRSKSHETKYLLVNATPRRNAENKIIGVVAMAQDVTEAAKHDRAVAAMASELRQLIDTANAPIFGIDCDGYVCCFCILF
jgi:PAS domain S-box-containing protein